MVKTMGPCLAIDTERLLLRSVGTRDWGDIYQCLTDREVMEYEPVLTEEQRRRWVDDCIASGDFWAVCLADSGKMIGNIYLGKGAQDNWEIGYMLRSRYHKQGYAVEAIDTLLGHVFYVRGAHRVYAYCNRENASSWRLLEKLGFRREGIIKQNIYFRQGADGEPIWQDTLIYGILKDEWAARHM